MLALKSLVGFMFAATAQMQNIAEVPNVTLDDGTIVMGGSHVKGTVSYWGIRYGEVPERFAAARRWHANPGTVIDGRKLDTTSCWQSLFYNGTYFPKGSEDCLFLDVNAPTVPDKGGSAVMVWIHGGGLTLGSKSTPEGLSAFVLEGNVVTVAINYRLAVMGFFAESGVPSNNGIRDQILALQWINANIAGFGGDPDRITIFGESAGGLSTTVLSLSPLARGLFQRVIAQSPMWQDAGQFRHSMAVAHASTSAQCMGMVGCETVECMRSKSPEAFLRCNMQSGTTFIGKEGQVFTGFDGEVLPRPLYDMLCSGTTNNVDIIVGGLPHEWRLFQDYRLSIKGLNVTAINPGFPDPKGGIFPLDGAITKFLTGYVEDFASSTAHAQECATAKILKYYQDAPAFNTCPGCTEFNSSHIVRMMQATTDIEGTLGAQLLAQSAGGSRYRYLFNNDGDGNAITAKHADDCAYFCSFPGDCDGSKINTPQKTALGRTLRGLWTAFAKTGTPASGEVTWPTVNRSIGLGIPLLNMCLNGTSTQHSAWFNNEAAELLARIACGKVDMERLGCRSSLIV